ncbi:MAG TPA: acyl-CoA dehydrogenase family protein, partial [Longimicrobiales bacterium]|nr:acyl-CoA dehydrogenase family protein [Longimicrobiales bacterium]
MSSDTSQTPHVHDEILPLAPLIYVAWADRHLSRREAAAIRRVVREPQWRDTGVPAALERWLDPRNPPEPQRLQALLESIRSHAAAVPPEQRGSLVDLGQALASSTGRDLAFWTRDDVAASMRSVQDALGVVPAEAARALVEDSAAATAEARTPTGAASFDVRALQALLDGRHAPLRAELKEILREAAFRADPGTDSAIYRRTVLGWLRLLADGGFGAVAFPPEFGGQGDIAGAVAVFETLALRDLSLTVKFGVHFGLFGGSVLLLGTRRHHDKYLREVGTLQLPGCFAMTETGHG